MAKRVHSHGIDDPRVAGANSRAGVKVTTGCAAALAPMAARGQDVERGRPR